MNPAHTASPDSAILRAISREEMATLPIRRDEGEVSLVATLSELERAREDLAQEHVRDLDEDARAVAGERVGARGAPVVEVPQGGEGVLDDVVAGTAAHGRDHGDAARVVLQLAAVQPGVRRLRREEGALPKLIRR